jgi:hypothetical protein
VVLPENAENKSFRAIVYNVIMTHYFKPWFQIQKASGFSFSDLEEFVPNPPNE